jgi:predicted ATPase/GAF domain-containing protein
MSALIIRTAHVVKADPYFQLQRVITSGGEELLVKLALTDDRGNEEKLLEQEFRLFDAVGPQHALTSARLARLDGRLAACYEAFDGEPLCPRATGTFDLAEIIELTSDMCAILAALHARGTILLGVSPSSFLRSPRSRRLVLADAPFAQPQGAVVDRNDAYWIESPHLAYAAPELIGGASRPVDHRADLYALGAVLYHLIAHRPLFDADDPAEIIGRHLAREPRHLLELAPMLPPAVASAVMKLLAKNPLDRFASVEAFEQAIAADIDAWREPSVRSERTPRASPIALSFSTRRFGQDDPTSVVRHRFRGSRSHPALVIVEGDAGVGKSTLLREVQRLESDAYFCRGAFTGTGPARPLSGWTAALIDLANIALTSRAGALERWRDQIQRQLGEWAPLIAALAPEWQTILRCPRLPTDDPGDASLNRIALAIRRLIGCFADDESPVVVVLDDLQWADASSLGILEIILRAPEPLNLLVLAAVRDGKGARSQRTAVIELRERLIASGIEVASVRLQPWSRRDIRGFVAESLRRDDIEDAAELSELILAKTHGNPFFVRELLRLLVQKRAIYVDTTDDRLRWDKQVLRRLPVTDNVVVFLSHRIEGLPTEVKEALRVCACLGNELSLADFCRVTERDPVIAGGLLRRAVAEGLLAQRDSPRAARLPATAQDATIDAVYEFVHDRVHEAARGLLSSDDGAATHLRIGRMLSRDPGHDADETRLYKIASHFNLARRLITDRPERETSAELNLKAGRQAKLRGAFSQALDFLLAGLAFLGERHEPWAHDDAWRSSFALTLALYEETAGVALLNSDLPLLTRLCDEILRRTDTPEQKVLAYELRICGLKSEKRFSEAVDTALEILRELGVEFPRRPTLLHAVIGFLATKRRLFKGPLARLAALPAMRDSRIKAADRIIQSVYSAAYLGRPRLFPLLVYRHVRHSLEHGNEDYSGGAYAAFGVMLSATARFGDAMQLGEIGLGLLRSCNADRLKAGAFMTYYSFIFPWKNHIRDTLPYYREGLDAGLAHGEFEYASYIMTFDSLARLHSGVSLTDLQAELERYGAKIESLGQERSIMLQNMLCQVAFALRHGPEGSNPLTGRFYDEAKQLPRCLEPLEENLVFHNYLAKMTLCIFLGDHEGLLACARRGRVYLRNGGFANYLAGVFMTYESLAYLMTARKRGNAMMRRVRRNQRQLKVWAKAAPMNFQHKYHLVEAERYRYLGDHERASEHFEKAIELSQAHGFAHEAGLAYERAAAFSFERGMERLGRQYLRDSYLSYRRWGAEAVTRRLEAQYMPHFAILGTTLDGPLRRSAPRISETLDYRTLLKSSQAISGEILLPRLLERLLTNILEHAGAQRAVLVLERRGELYVEAEADIDSDGPRLIEPESVEDSDRVCAAIVLYTARLAAPLVLPEADREGMFVNDPYVHARQLKSVLCAPVLYQSKLVGLIYLENNRVPHVFTDARLEVVNLLAGQAAISITNAKLHALELEAQQAKINPHFLFNALSSIAELAVSDGAKAEIAIVKLASLYRYVLTNSMDELVSLEQELEIVRNYLTLEKLRFGGKLEYFVTIEGDASRVKLPGLLIQPLVENSIRHGVAPKLAPGTVTVQAVVRGDRCCIVVQDDGDGSKHATAGTGLGLRSVQERLALAYGQRFSFAISRNDGYRVEVEIPAG